MLRQAEQMTDVWRAAPTQDTLLLSGGVQRDSSQTEHQTGFCCVAFMCHLKVYKLMFLYFALNIIRFSHKFFKYIKRSYDITVDD